MKKYFVIFIVALANTLFLIAQNENYPVKNTINIYLEGQHNDNTIFLKDLLHDDSFTIVGKDARQYKIIDGYISFHKTNHHEYHVSSKKLPLDMKAIIEKEKGGVLKMDRFTVVHIATGEKFKLKELTLTIQAE
jgi:hypothetical protein